MWVELYSGHSKWDWLRPTEYFSAFAGWNHSEWDRSSLLGVELSGGHSKWDRLRPVESQFSHCKNMATQNESILALLRLTEIKWVPKWPIESLFDSIVFVKPLYLTFEENKFVDITLLLLTLVLLWNTKYHWWFCIRSILTISTHQMSYILYIAICVYGGFVRVDK